MRRLLVLALLGLVAGRADAQLLKITNGDYPKKRHKSGNEPPPLGPWYNYWPMEAHFQVPAMPEYPYWGAPQTLPVVPPAPYGAQPAFGGPGAGNGLGGYPGNGFRGHPGFAPGNNAAPAPANQPPAQMQPAGSGRAPYQANPYPALSGYPGYGYPGYGYPGYGYSPQWQARPPAAANPGNPQQRP